MTGVYTITNKTTGKIYVGSSTVSIIKRMNHHYYALKTNTHKNPHLQRAWNKYGESDFLFEELELCDKEFCLSTEQYWINMLDVTNKGYNINPLASGTPDMSKETIEKRRQTMLKKYANGEINMLGRVAWNKGMKMPEDHIQKLKDANRVFTENGKKKKRESIRSRLKSVQIYTLNGIFLKEFRSAYDLEDWSLTTQNNLPISGRFSKSRKGKPLNYLQAFHVIRCCNNKIDSYKGLVFKYK